MQSFTVCFLLPFIFTVHARVVDKFDSKDKCMDFLYKGVEPKLDASINDVRICQTFADQPRFATLYDTANRIPVYSAYTYEYKGGKCPREKLWSIEPQLLNQNWDKNMMKEKELKNLPTANLGDKQATNWDYTNLVVTLGYNRGHLNPNQHHSGAGCNATFTLTNVVPQNAKLNEVPWNNYEEKLKNTFKGCKTAHVVVGAIPSKNNWVKKANTNRINIPDYLWHAYCCVDNKGKFKTGAAAVRNENTPVVECSIDSLEEFFVKTDDRDPQFSSRMQSFTVCFFLPLIFTVHTERVINFQNNCKNFFYKGKEPQVRSPTNDVHICQTFGDEPRFATLYDTANRIPVYSAYIYERNNEGGREDYWLIEPQLVNQNWDKNMAWEGDLQHAHPGVQMGDKQALDSDYNGLNNYNRGHLNPNLHHGGDGRTATFTLTNAVPQNIQLNGGSWNDYETELRNILGDCHKAYVVVGAVPSAGNWVKNENRVNIPDYLWHAFCCVDDKGKPFKSGAAAVKNVNTPVVQCSLDSLNGFFEKAKSRIHKLFADKCDAPTSIVDGCKATFTLTNVVPQTKDLNGGCWNKYEKSFDNLLKAVKQPTLWSVQFPLNVGAKGILMWRGIFFFRARVEFTCCFALLRHTPVTVDAITKFLICGPSTLPLTLDGCKATFTLTNVVPQTKDLNSGCWNKYEKSFDDTFKGCKTAYAVVGAVSSKRWGEGHLAVEGDLLLQGQALGADEVTPLMTDDRDPQFSSRMQSFTVCFLLPLIFTVHARVVDKFDSKNKCDQFFYKRTEPQLNASNNYVRICQTFANQYHFATLYDTARRIPVYSAYTYEKNNETGREKRWFIEPQLVNQKWDKNMASKGDLEKKYGLGRNATFTLTNIVPQNATLNGGSWNKYETKLHKDTFKDCKTAYVVVGAVPSKDNWVIKNNQKRVNIPDYLWQAYCCINNNNKPFKSGAAAVRNVNTTVVQCSLDSLKSSKFPAIKIKFPSWTNSQVLQDFRSPASVGSSCTVTPARLLAGFLRQQSPQNKCDQFFYNRREPQVQRHNTDVHICQTLANQPRFATLYDTARRIPVYSAYKYERNNETGRQRGWFIEPQLVDQNWDGNMTLEGDLQHAHPGVQMGDKQAIDSDYTGLMNKSGYNRGHLNPNLHHSGLGRNATFTLTNIVPQNAKLNGGSWNKYETKLHNDTFKDCKTAYVVAYCCVDNNDRPYKSGAAAVRNNNTDVVECSLNSLK
ncbi:hypothetical protein INR49_006394, partial [Caranx melampygus]